MHGYRLLRPARAENWSNIMQAIEFETIAHDHIIHIPDTVPDGVRLRVRLSVEERRERKPTFWDEIQEWRAQASFEWPDLTPEEINGWRDKAPGRAFSWEE